LKARQPLTIEQMLSCRCRPTCPVRRWLARATRAVCFGSTAGVVGAAACAGAAGAGAACAGGVAWAGGAGWVGGAGCWATTGSVAATTIETTAIAIFERIGRSIRLRRYAAAALNHHSIAGGLTSNCNDTNSARRVSAAGSLLAALPTTGRVD